MEDHLCAQNVCTNSMSTSLDVGQQYGVRYSMTPEPQNDIRQMEVSEYAQAKFRESAEAAGVCDDESVTELFHLLPYQKSIIRYFQNSIDKMDRTHRSIAENIESRIREAEMMRNENL